MSSNRSGKPSLKVAVLGTRGIPARYGGFETFAQELSLRLVARGHRVTVYGRPRYVDPNLEEFQGVKLRVLPAIRHKYLETVSHTIFSIVSSLFESFDVVLVCNGANAFLCWLPRLVRVPVVLNVDGIERLRKKWNWLGRTFYRLNEFLTAHFPSRVVSDARVIQEYYRSRYRLESTFIPYGASVESVSGRATLDRLGLQPGGYLLYVSRLEPENNAHRVIEAYREAAVHPPLVVVGDAPYARKYVRELHRLARGARILLPGAIYGSGYRELLSHCLCYLQATEVGGTHPALIEAMGAGCLVLANDTPENREVAGETARYFDFGTEGDLARLLRRVCAHPEEFDEWKKQARNRVRERYSWETVVDQYEELFHELAAGRGD